MKGSDCQAETLCLLRFSELQRLLELALVEPAMTVVKGSICVLFGQLFHRACMYPLKQLVIIYSRLLTDIRFLPLLNNASQLILLHLLCFEELSESLLLFGEL